MLSVICASMASATSCGASVVSASQVLRLERKPCGRASMPLRSISRAMVASLITPFLTDGNREAIPSQTGGPRSMTARASADRGTRKSSAPHRGVPSCFRPEPSRYHLQSRLAEETGWAGSEGPSGSAAEAPGCVTVGFIQRRIETRHFLPCQAGYRLHSMPLTTKQRLRFRNSL